MVVFVFPGQGSQYSGMGKEFYENYPIIKKLFKRAKDILNWDPYDIIFSGKDENLKKTVLTQPSIYLVSYSLFEIWKERGEILPDYVMGHSLGEYTALAASNVFSFEEGLKIVKIRAELMDKAKEGKMAAIIGLDREKVEEIVKKGKNKGIIVCANYNSPKQIVISGERSALKYAEKLAKENGARKVIYLRLSGAFHSPIMEEISKEFSQEIAKINFNKPKFKIISNVTAREELDPEKIKENLILQLTEPVRWEDSVKYVWEKGVNTFVEIGPGKVLTGLIKRTIPQAKAIFTDNLGNFLNSIKFLEGENGKTSG